MAKKLAVVVLLALFSFTGSVVAFAAHDHRAHQQTLAASHAHLQSLAAEQAPTDHTTDDFALCSCDGLCDLVVADLYKEVDFGLCRKLRRSTCQPHHRTSFSASPEPAAALAAG